MSEDESMHYLKKNYAASFDYLIEEDAVDAYELSRERDLDLYETGMMLSALNRLDYLEVIDREEGAFYSVEEFDIDTHVEIMEHFFLNE